MKELEEHKINLRNSLKVPDTYFNTNKSRLLALAKEDTNSQTLTLAWKKAVVWVSVAAIITLGMFVYFQKSSTSPNSYSLHDIANDSIVDYLLSEYEYSLEEPLITEALATVEFPEWLVEDLSDDEIVEFLNHTGMDESTLYMDYED